MNNISTGFYFSNSKLQVMEIGCEDTIYSIRNISEVYFNEVLDFTVDKNSRILEQLQAAYNEILLDFPVKTTSAAFALPNDFFYVMQVPFENTLKNDDLIREFKWEFSLLYPYVDPEDLVIQFIEIPKNSYMKHQTAIVIAVRQKYLQVLNAFCRKNNILLKHIESPHIAAERIFTASRINMFNKIIVSIFISNKDISIIISDNLKPVYFKIIKNIDFTHIPEIIKEELNTNGIIDIKADNADHCFVLGDSLNLTFLERLNTITGIKFEPFNLTDNMNISLKRDNNKYLNKVNSFSASAGAALRLFKDLL